MNKVWDNYNRGVRTCSDMPRVVGVLIWNQRQWKDIRSKYAAEVEEDDE